MIGHKQCLRCGSTNIDDGEFRSTGKIYARPKHANLVALLTTGAPVDSILCYDCGHVELVVDTRKAKALAAVS